MHQVVSAAGACWMCQAIPDARQRSERTQACSGYQSAQSNQAAPTGALTHMISGSNSSAAQPRYQVLPQTLEAHHRLAREVELLDTPAAYLDFRIKDAAWCSVVSGGIAAVGVTVMAREILWPRDANDAKDSKLGLGAIIAGINAPVFFQHLRELGDAFHQRSQQRTLRSREVEIRREFEESAATLRRCEMQAAASYDASENMSDIVVDDPAPQPEGKSGAGSRRRRMNHPATQGLSTPTEASLQKSDAQFVGAHDPRHADNQA